MCSKVLDRGEVCKDEIHDCERCKKNGEFIEVVVRCAQGRGHFLQRLIFYNSISAAIIGDKARKNLTIKLESSNLAVNA